MPLLSKSKFFSFKRSKNKKKYQIVEPIVFFVVFAIFFGYLAYKMDVKNMMNTMMATAHDLLLNTVFFIMGITVLMGAFSKLLAEFGVVDLLEKLLRPLMKPLFNLPGVAALGAVVTFLSDNPAIITLSKNARFAQHFKTYQLISLTNFGTAWGMGLVVVVFMMAQGFAGPAGIGVLGAACGCMISTRLMQRFTLKSFPEYDCPAAGISDVKDAVADQQAQAEAAADSHKQGTFMRSLNAALDGGKQGVELGMAIIPGVLIISTVVMMLTFKTETFMGTAYEGVGLLPDLANNISFLFDWLFGFKDTELLAFPMTALGAVGAAIGLVPQMKESGILDGNAVAVFTAIGMCWSGYLSTHAAMLDSMGYRKLISKAILAHTIAGLCAGIIAHWAYVGFMALAAIFAPEPVWTANVDGYKCLEQEASMKLNITAYDDSTYVVQNWYGVSGLDLTFTVNEADSTINIIGAESQKDGYSFVRISNDSRRNEPAYAALYTTNRQSKFYATEDYGLLYVYAIIYDGNKRQLTRGYYELVWGGAHRETHKAEESIKLELAKERAEAELEADSIIKQQIVDSLLMEKHAQ